MSELENARFAEVASLAGDKSRAAMLRSLMGGRALTASELARIANITPQTASAHLARLQAAGLIEAVKQGRHRYHRLATPAVARMIESIMQAAFDADIRADTLVTGPRDAAMRLARTCYDHLGGRLGVAIADALIENGHLELSRDFGMVTSSGVRFMRHIGIDLPGLASGRGLHDRDLCRPCLDWSERRPHLAGALGTALYELSLQQDWIRRRKDSRAVTITAKGLRCYRETLKLRL